MKTLLFNPFYVHAMLPISVHATLPKVVHAKLLITNAMIMEKDKCEIWEWVDPLHIPTPHFDASEFAIECFLKQRFYIAGQKG